RRGQWNSIRRRSERHHSQSRRRDRADADLPGDDQLIGGEARRFPARGHMEMKFADHLFRTAGACLLAIALFGGAPAQAQAVSNIATARWSVGEQEFAVDSNEVAFDVVARAGELTTFVVQPGGSEHALLQARYCGAPLKSAR